MPTIRKLAVTGLWALSAIAISHPVLAQAPAAPAPAPAPAAAPPPALAPTAKPAPVPKAAASAAVFPAAPSSKYAKEKPGSARMHTCLDQYHVNKAANANGGLKWIQKGGGYYSQCLKKMKA